MPPSWHHFLTQILQIFLKHQHKESCKIHTNHIKQVEPKWAQQSFAAFVWLASTWETFRKSRLTALFLHTWVMAPWRNNIYPRCNNMQHLPHATSNKDEPWKFKDLPKILMKSTKGLLVIRHAVLGPQVHEKKSSRILTCWTAQDSWCRSWKPQKQTKHLLHEEVLLKEILDTPWKINMEHNHRGLEDHFPF